MDRDGLAAGFAAPARQDSSGIRGQVVVLDSSPSSSLKELDGQSVACANPYAFAG